MQRDARNTGAPLASGAAIGDTPDGVEVRLNVEGRAHDHHDGSDESVGEIEYPLTPVVAKPEGTGSSTTVINGATVQQFISGKEFYLNVHAEATGSEGLPDSLACGDLLVDDEKVVEHAHE